MLRKIDIHEKKGLLYTLSILILALLLLPKSIGGFYQVNMLPEIFSDILNTNLTVGVYTKSFSAYLALMRTLLLVCNTNASTISYFAGLLSILYIILSYFLLSSVVQGGKMMKNFIAYFYSIIFIGFNAKILSGTVSIFTVILSTVILFFILNESKKENYVPMFIIVLVSWIALGFFWHTMHVAMYIIIILNLLIEQSYERDIKWNFLILISVIFIATWIYIRTGTLDQIFHNPYIDLNFSTLYSLFLKGSTAGKYSFISTLPTKQIDYIRYLIYIIAYGTMFTLIRKRDIRTLASRIIIVLLLSDIIFQILYFISTGTVGPRILITFSIPILLIILDSSDFKNRFTKCISILLIILLIIGTMSSFYAYILEDPANNLNAEIYEASFFWTIEYFDEISILSDAHTIGHYRLLYASSEINNCKMQSRDIRSYSYGQIAEGIYKNRQNNILVLNIKLYEKHLILGSLEDWNKFEPLSPYSLIRNKLNCIYNDGNLMVSK